MIRNLTRKTILSHQTCYARGFFMRGRGMIGRRFESFDAMVFEKCSAIHTCFMSFPIDVVFLNKENRIIMVKEALKPWCPLVSCKKAFSVIELPAGTLKKTCTEPGDCVDLDAELTAEALLKWKNKGLVQTAETLIPCGEKEK